MCQISNMLEDEISRRIEKLEGVEPGSEESTKAITDLVKLIDAKNETDDRIIEHDKESFEEAYKEEQAILEEKHQKSEHRWKIALIALESLPPMLLSMFWLHKGFKFEETGTITSSTMKWLTGRLPNFFKKK